MTTLVIGAVFVVWGSAVVGGEDAFQRSLVLFATSLPDWIIDVLRFAYTLGLLYSVVVVVLLLVKGRWAAVRDVVLAAAGAACLSLVLVAVFDELWPTFFNEVVDGPVQPQFPVVRVSIVTATLVASAPYLVRPIRRLGWLIVVLVSGAAIALALSVPSGVWAAVGVGLVAAAVVLLIFGSPRGYPDVEAVAQALQLMGHPVRNLTVAPRQSWGVRELLGETDDGTAIAVKAYGRDATDSQLAARAWRRLLYRGAGGAFLTTRLQSVEHEALMTIAAQRSGVTVPEIIVAASATDEVAVLARTSMGQIITDDVRHEYTNQEVLRRRLVGLWQDLGRLHAAGIVHGHLDLMSLRSLPDGFGIVDFGDAQLDPKRSDAGADVAQLLFATTALVPPDIAVAAAVEGIGSDPLTQALPYLQVPAMSRRSRRDVAHTKQVLAELREAVASACGTDVPAPVRIRRFGLRQLLTLLLVGLFMFALVPLLTSVDYAQLWASISSATWWLVLLALLAGQLAFIPQGTAMMSAVGRAIPLRPMTILQPAIAFISFAVPGVAGRVAMEGSFLYKFGIAPAVAVTKGAVDAFSGFLVQAAILVMALLTGQLLRPASTDSGSSASDSGSGTSWLVIALIVALAVATVVVVLKVPKLHDRVVPQIRSAWQALAEVFRSPRLALGLLGSQLAVQLLWGLGLWLALLSLGVHLNVIACTAVVVATSLLQGVIPVPGGIGVSEAVLSAFLVPLGVSPEVAMGAAVIWRVATFYLPAIEGFVASKYLSSRGYL